MIRWTVKFKKEYQKVKDGNRVSTPFEYTVRYKVWTLWFLFIPIYSKRIIVSTNFQ